MGWRVSPAVGKCVLILSPQLLKLPEFCLWAARVEDCRSQAADGGGGQRQQASSGMGRWSGDASRSAGPCGFRQPQTLPPSLPPAETLALGPGPGSCPGCWGSHGNMTALAFPTGHVPRSGALFAEYPFPRCSQARIIHSDLSSMAPPQRAVSLPSALSPVLLSSQHYGYLEVSYLCVV